MQQSSNHGFVPAIDVLLCGQAKEKSSPARVISLSSAAHQFPQKFDLGDIHYRHRKYQKQMAYGYSKLANVLFARELARR